MAKQRSLEERFKDIEWCNYVWGLVEEGDRPLTYVDAWLLCGNYKSMNELPLCEELSLGIPHTYPSLTLREDLAIPRMIACKSFRGVISNKPVSMAIRIEDPPGAAQKHIYVEGDKPFTIETGNEPFLPDEIPPLRHMKLSREYVIERVNEVYMQLVNDRRR